MPKDLDNIQAKQIGPFTWRQIAGLAFGGGVIFLLWSNLKGLVPEDVCGVLCILAATPFLAVGFIPKAMLQNLYAEQFVAMIMKYNILRPPVRKYKTANYYDGIRNEILLEEKQNKVKKKLTSKERKAQRKANAAFKGVR